MKIKNERVVDSTYWAFTRLLRIMEPETLHHVAIWSTRYHMAPRLPSYENPVLESTVLGQTFPNPIGLAAGFDKNAIAVNALQRQGFGFVEVGSVTPRPQPGNPRPRLFRLTLDRAVINRMGFNNDGHAAVVQRIKRRKHMRPVGVNLGKNKDSTDAVADYVAGIKTFAPFADYLVINVSSPNTPGLRALQGKEPLTEILEAAMETLTAFEASDRPPLFLKIAPDLSEAEQEDVAQVALSAGVDGLIATNTTLSRPDRLRDHRRMEEGGLSGRPLFDLSTQVLSNLYRLTGGQIPIIGSGGIGDGETAYAKIKAGASLLQVYTAFIYEGPGLLNQIKRDLAVRLRADGFKSITEAIGADHRT